MTLAVVADPSTIRSVIRESGPGYRGNGVRRRSDIPERLLARLWQRRAARQAWFRAHGGQRVRVIYPGRPGLTAGPDFRDALLEVEGVGLVRGDVEIHIRQQDWPAHGHGDDPRYNGVVLHAALETQPADTKLQSGGTAPVVSLAPLMDVSPPPPEELSTSPLWEFLAPLGYPRPETLEEAAALLDRAGDDRFAVKSAQFRTYLAEQEAEQTLYQGIMEGLGYRQNEHPFQLLAQRAPFHALRSAALRLPEEERLHAVRRWLTAMSGLSVPGLLAEDAEVKTMPRAGFGRPLGPDSWRLFRVRPSNHPLRRIAGAAVLLVRFLEPGLVDGLRQACRPGKPSHLTSALAAPGEGRRARRRAGGPRAGAGLGGERRAALPARGVRGVKKDRGPRSRSDAQPDGPYPALYHKFGKLQENEVTREVAEQLLPSKAGGRRSTPPAASKDCCTCITGCSTLPERLAGLVQSSLVPFPARYVDTGKLPLTLDSCLRGND